MDYYYKNFNKWFLCYTRTILFWHHNCINFIAIFKYTVKEFRPINKYIENDITTKIKNKFAKKNIYDIIEICTCRNFYIIAKIE